MSDIDQIMLENFPVLTAPFSDPLPSPTKPGTRYVLARNGLYQEVSTFWMIRRRLLAACYLPYGETQEHLEFLMNAPPDHLWREFIAIARASLPNECAGLMVWNIETQEWRLAMREALRASPGRIDYREPALDPDEVAVVDIHSHGSFGAGFSARDNRDDLGGIKVAAVVGRVNRSIPEIALRLVAMDEVIPIQLMNQKFILKDEKK